MNDYEALLRSVDASTFIVSDAGSSPLPSELHLQSLWFSGQMGRKFQTVNGLSVKVIQFGHWNHSSGPDFLHAAVEIEGTLYRGPIELDHGVSEWEAHGHGENEQFDSVILHVVFRNDSPERFTRTSNHRDVPRVFIPESVWKAALNRPVIELSHVHPGACVEPLANMSPDRLERLFLGAARYRAQIKLRRRNRTVEVLGEDEWLWQVLAETLGYRPNRLAMTLLAQRLPVSDFIQNLEKKGQSEAILFGAAGFIRSDEYKQAPDDSQEYLRGLWENWWKVRDHYEPVRERQIPWTLSGVRPVNHPQRRIACLERVLASWKWFKKLSLSPSEVERYFLSLEHPYWSYHYTLKSKRSEKKLALMGKDRIQDFIINHLLPPKLASNDDLAWKYYLKLPAPAMSESVKNASIRLFGASTLRKHHIKKAWQHQALLQIYQDFCLRDASDCSDCLFPRQLEQWMA